MTDRGKGGASVCLQGDCAEPDETLRPSRLHSCTLCFGSMHAEHHQPPNGEDGNESWATLLDSYPLRKSTRSLSARSNASRP